MNDDIIDTIALALIGPLWAGFEGADNCYCDPEMDIIDTSGNWVSFCMGDVTKTVAPLLLAALRERYAIVEREELASSLASAIRAYIDAEVAGGRTADRGINVLQRLDYEADSIARYALTHESLKEADQ